MTDKSPREQLQSFVTKYPDRVQNVERHVRRLLGISPRVEAPATVNVFVDDILGCVFGVVPEGE